MRAKLETEPIANIAGNNVQMSMKYLLPCSIAVGELEVYSFTPDTALTQYRGEALRNTKHSRAFLLIQLCKVTGMSIGNYERMPGIDGLMIQKS